MISIIPQNFMMTNDEASQKLCPETLKGNAECCCPNTCMAWVEANKRIEREDHSGANVVIQEEAQNRNFQEVKRKGGPGSMGYLYLEAQGFCLKLWKSHYE